MLNFLPLLLAGAAAAPEPRDSPVNSSSPRSLPIEFPNNTASVTISAGTPPQEIAVELTLNLGQLHLAKFEPQDSSSFQDNPPRDDIKIGDALLKGWEISNGTNDAGLGGTLPFGMASRGNGKIDQSSIPWALANNTGNNFIGLDILADSGEMYFSPESSVVDEFWNPIEDSQGAWALIIDGLAVDGKMVVIEEDEPVTVTRPANGVQTGSPPMGSSELPPTEASPPPVKRTTPATPLPPPPTPTPTDGSETPTPVTNGKQCTVTCTAEYKMCICAEGEMCRRHPTSCDTCPFLECIRNGTSTDNENCIACPAIYRACNCGPDEDCVRTLATCKECEKVECRKRGSVTPADPQWEEETSPTATQTSPSTTPTGPLTTGTVPTEDKPLNCTNPVMCPAIYRMCTCRADEECVRKSRCDKCEWLECHKSPQESSAPSDTECKDCKDVPEPECDCERGYTCVREPRSCNSCGAVSCRKDTTPSLRFALSLHDEIAISPHVATALQKLIPGMHAMVDGHGKRAPVATATASSGSSDGSTGVSVNVPPPPMGKTYYSVPCNTTADLTLVFPRNVNLTIEAKDWVVHHDNGCQAALVMQDTIFNDMILGRPFLRTVRTSFKLTYPPQVGFESAPALTPGAGATAMEANSGAGAIGISLAAVIAALAAVCML